MGEKKTDNAAAKKDETPTSVILKVDMHCDGCASKIIRFLRAFQGVETVKEESDTGKITITGNVEPTTVRDMLAERMKKKVELISPQPKKKNNNKDNKSEKKDDDEKPKELPVTTAVLKVALHCQGCVDRIRKTVSKTKGVYDMSIDKEKETITVKGTMDVKALVGNLTERLRRKVEVVPPKKDKGESEKDGGADKKKKKGDEGGENGIGKEEQQSRMEYLTHAYGYGYGVGGYNYGPFCSEHLHSSQIFSDENPNACSIM